MIIQEQKGNLVYTYSDRYMFIEREDGQKYASAYDVVPHTYTETDSRIYTEEDLREMEKADAETAQAVRKAYQE